MIYDVDLDARLALQLNAICVHQTRRLHHQNRILEQLAAHRLPHNLVSHPFSLVSVSLIASSPFSCITLLTSPVATAHFAAVDTNTLSISTTSLNSCFCSSQNLDTLSCALSTCARGGSPSCRTLIQISASLYRYTSTCRSLSSETTPHGSLARSPSASSALRMATTIPLVRSHRSLSASNACMASHRRPRSLASCSFRAALAPSPKFRPPKTYAQGSLQSLAKAATWRSSASAFLTSSAHCSARRSFWGRMLRCWRIILRWFSHAVISSSTYTMRQYGSSENGPPLAVVVLVVLVVLAEVFDVPLSPENRQPLVVVVVSVVVVLLEVVDVLSVVVVEPSSLSQSEQ
ncbi:hypothetical protein CKAH01_01782 [Colletotrichum kahawae]|uniref:Uncharacterized protein n=1 Tax=Colletotrichum kahawae TaxID=34407 RepID=A0AAD9Y5X0_COLKA|nr:hypothetical protein CKAH01_01782 [Colletotrichum kahawae]